MEVAEIIKLDTVDLIIQEGAASAPPEGSRPLVEDLWSFGSSWKKVKKTYSTVDNLYGAILDCMDATREAKEEWRERALHFVEPVQLEPISIGISGSYFLLDGGGQPTYVIKPMDEEAGCLNNPKNHRSPFAMSPVRDHMPLYCAPFREVASYAVAQSIGVGQVVPKTSLAILRSEAFYDFSEAVSQEELKTYLEQVGMGDKEKLCSAQEFVPHSKSLFTALHDLQAMSLSDEEIAARFDANDFEDANILLWITNETDGHAGNFLCYPKGTDAIGNEILGLKKVDNGFAFPEKNGHLKNFLSHLPNAKLPLSEQARIKIASIDVDAAAKILETYHLETSTKALQKRTALLKELAQDPRLTIQDINRKMKYAPTDS